MDWYYTTNKQTPTLYSQLSETKKHVFAIVPCYRCLVPRHTAVSPVQVVAAVSAVNIHHWHCDVIFLRSLTYYSHRRACERGSHISANILPSVDVVINHNYAIVPIVSNGCILLLNSEFRLKAPVSFVIDVFMFPFQINLYLIFCNSS